VIGRHLPNFVTLVRILLVAPLAWALLNEFYGLGLALFVIASASDALDGFLARHFGWTTPLGAILDPIADKLLLVTVYVTLGMSGFLPGWLVIVVVVRDVVIVSGALAYRALTGRFRMEPTFLSKLNTVLQLALALTAIAARGLQWLPPWSADLFVFAVLASTILSGLHYVGVWSRRAWQHKDSRP
jgi:cardiolipin synthase